MNDKQQLAAMGAEMAEQQQQPMCMAKRIEELEAQLAEKSIKVERLREMNLIAMKRVAGMLDRDLELSRLQSLMSEGWQLVPVEPTERMISESIDAGRFDEDDAVFFWASMLAAAPSPDCAK